MSLLCNRAGRVLVRAEVESILVEGSLAVGVKLKRAAIQIKAPIIVSTAG